MLFNSFNFIIFFIAVLFLYYILPYRTGIYMLLAASYIFYMCWNPALIVIIVFITIVNYVLAYLIGDTDDRRKKKTYLITAMVISFGLLFVFKYLNFAIDILNGILATEISHKDIVLPMGISFYTFQAAAYTIDVYRGELKSSRNFVKFSLFITFFPQLVAGPIERSKNLIKQFNRKNRFEIKNIVDGLELMAIGFFKKVVIADRISVGVNTVFNNIGAYSGLYYVLAAIMFTIQIYCDFSGYSDIARGAAKSLGFRLMVNFDRPFISSSIRDFWKRWHISLSTWFMDYVYIPLGGNRKGRLKKYCNLFITFMVSGLWHGAAYTFVIWGALHGIMLIVEDIVKTEYRKVCNIFGRKVIFERIFAIVYPFAVFAFVVCAFVFFRANSVADAFTFWSRILWNFRQWLNIQYLYEVITGMGLGLFELKMLFAAVMILFISEVTAGGNIAKNIKRFGIIPEIIYFSLIVLFILTAGVFYNAGEFIYFQF